MTATAVATVTVAVALFIVGGGRQDRGDCSEKEYRRLVD